MTQTVELESPGIAKVAAQLAVMLVAGVELRAIQSQNAPLARYFDQPGVVGNPGPSALVAVTGAVIYKIEEVQRALQETPYALQLTFDAASGAGRFRIDGGIPTAVLGTAIPAGGIVLTIPGLENIRNFRMMAEAAATLTFSRYLLI